MLYSLYIISGGFFCDFNLTTATFYLLGLAGLEFSIGFVLLILFKYANTSVLINLNNSLNLNNNFNHDNVYYKFI